MIYDEKYWQERFESQKHVPESVKRAIRRVYQSYPPECLPQGLCDPLYIMNVICMELGVGDGRTSFAADDMIEALRAVAALNEGQGRMNLCDVAGMAKQALKKAGLDR